MPDLWDSGGPSLLPPGSPERDELGRGGPEQTAAQAPQIDWDATGLSRAAAEPIAFGLDGAYGPAWQQDYGTLAGRTLTGAAPDEAFPAAATPDGRQIRNALTTILAPGAVGADHPDVQAVLRGALADGMPQADRATVNRAALTAAIERDPEALLDLSADHTITRERLEAWQNLAQRSLPSAVTDRMTAMNARIDQVERSAPTWPQGNERSPGWRTAAPLTRWSAQPLERAAGGTINMDYYAVTVSRLPEGHTPAGMLNYIRTHINEFVDTSKSSFTPYPNQPGGGDNVARWTGDGDLRTRDNPTGSFVSINIPHDPGTVAVIDSGPDHWTFAAVQSPQDKPHPVSGNREFGFTQNDDGSVTFYTRGVDRITTPLVDTVNSGARRTFGGEGPVFNGGDELWTSFQDRLASRLNAIEGSRIATVEEPVFVRPNWDRVDDVLMGRESADDFMRREARR